MLVNTFTIGSQVDSSVACDADGDFVVTWTAPTRTGRGRASTPDGMGPGIPEPSEFLVNTTTTSDQARSAIAMDAAGDFVVAWDSSLQDGSSGGVYTQRFDEATDDAGPFVTGASSPTAPSSPAGGSRRGDAGPARLVDRLSTTGGVTGSNSATNPANWRLSRDGVDTSSAIQSVAFAFNAATRKYEATLSLSPLLVAGTTC